MSVNMLTGPNLSASTLNTAPHSQPPNLSTTSLPSIASFSQDEPRSPRDEMQDLHRPRLLSRKSSGTIIVPREHPHVELHQGEEVFDEDDARAMSPRRNSQDLQKMGVDAREDLEEHARSLARSLREIFNRIEAVKQEHDKLDNNNKFLQKYIGDLMSTSKITSTGAAGRKK